MFVAVVDTSGWIDNIAPVPILKVIVETKARSEKIAFIDALMN